MRSDDILTLKALFMDNRTIKVMKDKAVDVCEYARIHNAEKASKTILKKWAAENKSCRLEVTLRYPQELWEKHHDFVLAPYNRVVGPSELTDYQKSLGASGSGRHKKLVADFHERKMVVDLQYLRFLVDQGLEVVDIHEGVSFITKAWMKPFIELNTGLRAKATNNADKDLFKLMNNSVYGKTMENVREDEVQDIRQKGRCTHQEASIKGQLHTPEA
eukprot:TRINITY_DN582_c0_g1_i1.p1 TRINITY_DN582_c0_g1~~TRINITY_DN582_c0_g1_i1.p1  ORF type:complete len:217 (+),score=24.20 TRINITY_DN582_c0_g1_i1:185-835(+)